MADTPKSNEQVARAWCAVTISKWRRNFSSLAIGASGQLRSSFKAAVTSGSGVITIRLSHAYYGKFTDMGVGKGSKLGSNGKPVRVNSATGRQLRGKGRRTAKRWYSDSIGKETSALSHILTRNTGSFVSARLTDQAPSQVTLQF